MGTPSHGSLLHETGVCQPCAWAWRHEECHKDMTFMRCHLFPEGESKRTKGVTPTMMRLGLLTPTAATTASNTQRNTTTTDPSFLEPMKLPLPSTGASSPTAEPAIVCSTSPSLRGLGHVQVKEETNPEAKDREKALVKCPLLNNPPGLQPLASIVDSGSMLHGIGNCGLVTPEAKGATGSDYRLFSEPLFVQHSPLQEVESTAC